MKKINNYLIRSESKISEKDNKIRIPFTSVHIKEKSNSKEIEKRIHTDEHS